MSILEEITAPNRSAQKRLLVAVVAQAESDRVALSTAFAQHPTQRIVCSTTLDAAPMTMDNQPIDAIVGFVDDHDDWKRFKELACQHPRALTVLLMSDPEHIDSGSDSRLLNAVVATSRQELTSQASTLTTDVAAKHGSVGTSVAQANALDQKRLTSLSEREREILILTARGYAIKEIAARISRSYGTVATHRVKIMEKLGLHDKVALTRFAIRTGLIPA
jgi:DNA-binding NarL/FixJ family response regulator